MTELAFCPTCGIPWPNFCPLDGTRLSGPWSCKNAPKPVVRTPGVPAAQAPEAAPAPAPAAAEPAPAPAPAAPAPQRPAPAAATSEAEGERPRRRADPGLVDALLGQAGARSSTPQTRGGGRRAREMPTTILPSVPAPAPAADPAEAPAKTTPAKKKRAKGEFSDTQWFMKGKNLQVADPDTGTVVVDEEAYVVDESIPEEERRKFTLRKPEED